LGDRLPYQSLALFLEWAHDRIAADWTKDQIAEAVERILHDIGIVSKARSVSTLSTASNKDVDMKPFVAAVRQSLCEIRDFLVRQGKEIREQHGGVQTHASIDDLMIKIGECVDKSALVALEAQVFAIHGEQIATANSRGADYIDELVCHIGGVLGQGQDSAELMDTD
jgi:hypothetical protein